VTKINLLGFRINNDGPMTNMIFQELYAKISQQITCWDRYRLSLPGRINIYKTLLLSRISFHSSILMPSADILRNIQQLIDNFVIGNLKIGKNRLYRSTNEGRLGIVNLEHFIIGLSFPARTTGGVISDP
jgi:hypothetical protein